MKNKIITIHQSELLSRTAQKQITGGAPGDCLDGVIYNYYCIPTQICYRDAITCKANCPFKKCAF